MGRYKSIERAPAGRPVRIALRGETYEGTYRVDGPVITVETLMFGTARRPIGDNPLETLAKLMLAELVEASGKAR